MWCPAKFSVSRIREISILHHPGLSHWTLNQVYRTSQEFPSVLVDLKSNHKVHRSYNSQHTITQRISCQACCNMQGLQIDKIITNFPHPLACIEASSTAKASQRGYNMASKCPICQVYSVFRIILQSNSHASMRTLAAACNVWQESPLLPSSEGAISQHWSLCLVNLVFWEEHYPCMQGSFIQLFYLSFQGCSSIH